MKEEKLLEIPNCNTVHNLLNVSTYLSKSTVVMGRTMFDVRSSFDRRQKLGVRVRLLTDEHVQCSFDVRSTVRRTFNEHRKQNLSIL